MIRAKFKVNAIRASLYNTYNAETKEAGAVEMHTIELSPVYSTNPESENKKFWDYAPSGKIELDTINPGAWKHFKLGGEYYIDFTEASDENN